MSEISEPRQELQGIADSYYLMDRLLEENEEFKARFEISERRADLLESENETLRREIKRANSERDHYSRAFTGLSAQLDGLAAGMVNAVSQSRVQAYGGRRPQTELERMAPEGNKDLPSFLRRLQDPSNAADNPPPAEPPRPPIDLNELAASIAG